MKALIFSLRPGMGRERLIPIMLKMPIFEITFAKDNYFFVV